MLQHPEITHIEETGYPSWLQDREDDQEEFDEDSAYEESRDSKRFGGED